MDQPREVVFHQSANRPTLILGCDRQLVLTAAFFAVLMAFSLMSLAGAAVAAGFWLVTVGVLRRMGKADPLLREVYLEHIQQNNKPWYSAQGHRRSTSVEIPTGDRLSPGVERHA